MLIQLALERLHLLLLEKHEFGLLVDLLLEDLHLIVVKVVIIVSNQIHAIVRLVGSDNCKTVSSPLTTIHLLRLNNHLLLLHFHWRLLL